MMKTIKYLIHNGGEKVMESSFKNGIEKKKKFLISIGINNDEISDLYVALNLTIKPDYPNESN